MRHHTTLSRSSQVPAPRRRSGFTLIELLTVIAIIGILAAILIPVVAKVRNVARFSTNVSNVRQWTIACTLHMNDWKGFMPWQGPALSLAAIDSEVPFTNARVLPWYNALPPYIGEKTLKERKALNSLPKLGDNSVWVSPLADPSSPTYASNPWAGWTCYSPARSSNTEGSTDRYVASMNTLDKWSKRAVPSRTVMFGETPHFTNALYTDGKVYSFINSVGATPNSLGPYNRNGGRSGKAALGFFDGSVRTLTAQEIMDCQGTSGSNLDNHGERGNNPLGIVWRLTPN